MNKIFIPSMLCVAGSEELEKEIKEELKRGCGELTTEDEGLVIAENTIESA